MTVDEILATGEYTDRRGRGWETDDHWHDYWSTEGGPHAISRTQMRLLIERDQHRDVCDGLIDCGDHPVPVVEIDGPVISRTGCYYVRAPKSWKRVGHKHDLESAMDIACKLVVGG